MRNGHAARRSVMTVAAQLPRQLRTALRSHANAQAQKGPDGISRFAIVCARRRHPSVSRRYALLRQPVPRLRDATRAHAHKAQVALLMQVCADSGAHATKAARRSLCRRFAAGAGARCPPRARATGFAAQADRSQRLTDASVSPAQEQNCQEIRVLESARRACPPASDHDEWVKRLT